ncbi:MAG TPA: flagellar basal body rod protein FlgB [Pseudobdellovibrionaceae bacterium]|nr:flagellar basal body rod protein FlgB [Pseudobdellovibrionaceae bacterium]
MSLFDKTAQALQTSLNMRQIKQSITSSNIANAETPGYHAQKMDFEEALSRSLDIDGLRSMSANHGDHFSVGGKTARVRPEIYDNPEGAVNNDGNTVDLEKEMSALSENAIMYKAALQLINKKMAALKYAASEGR